MGDRVRRGGAKRIRESVKLPGFLQRGPPKAGADSQVTARIYHHQRLASPERLRFRIFGAYQLSQTNFLLKVETIAILLSDE
jgi:hypothetical protein